MFIPSELISSRPIAPCSSSPRRCWPGGGGRGGSARRSRRTGHPPGRRAAGRVLCGDGAGARLVGSDVGSWSHADEEGLEWCGCDLEWWFGVLPVLFLNIHRLERMFWGHLKQFSGLAPENVGKALFHPLVYHHLPYLTCTDTLMLLQPRRVLVAKKYGGFGFK